jgi:hypothetical protein
LLIVVMPKSAVRKHTFGQSFSAAWNSFFCAHHGTQHKEAIADHLLWWQDETFRLTEKKADHGE